MKNKWGAAISGSGEIEQHGIESIPDKDRTAMIFDFMRIEWGGSNSLATAVLGAFPIIFGLSFWQAFAATVAGVLAGAGHSGPISRMCSASRPRAPCIAATTILGTASRMTPHPRNRGRLQIRIMI
jgi:purine-cytosine permease-like protein